MNAKYDHPYIGIDAIILSENKEILLVKRSKKSKAYPDMWSLPSGLVEWGEEIKETVIREVKEETGLDVEVEKFTGKYYDKTGRHPSKTMICLPHYCKIVGGELESSSDAQDTKWFNLSEVKVIDLAFDHKQMLIDEGII